MKAEDLYISAWASKPVNGFCNAVSRGINIVHLPTGLTVTCDSERSQHRNKAAALAELQSKLADLASESTQPIKQVTEPPLDARNMAAGTHCWAIHNAKLIVVMKHTPFNRVEQFYIGGSWGTVLSEKELTLLEVIARPVGYEGMENSYE